MLHALRVEVRQKRVARSRLRRLVGTLVRRAAYLVRGLRTAEGRYSASWRATHSGCGGAFASCRLRPSNSQHVVCILQRLQDVEPALAETARKKKCARHEYFQTSHIALGQPRRLGRAT